MNTTLALNYRRGRFVGSRRVLHHSATVEERYLAERFPDSYPEYKASTKMLIPFIVLRSV